MELYNCVSGDSVSIGFLLQGYNMADAESFSVMVGGVQHAHMVIGNMVRVELKSTDTVLKKGEKEVILTVDDVNLGVKNKIVGTICFENKFTKLINESINEGYDVTVLLAITETGITVNDVMYNYVKGDKGEAGENDNIDNLTEIVLPLNNSHIKVREDNTNWKWSLTNILAWIGNYYQVKKSALEMYVSQGEKDNWNGKAAGNHNHNLNDLTEKSYNSLTDKPFIPTIDTNTVIDANYVHTDNNFDNAAKNKLTGIADNAQVNILDGVKVNGVDLPIANKKVNVTVPTTPSDIGAQPSGNYVLNNDSRLTDARPASDVYNWAKQSSKPIYTAGEVGAQPAGDYATNTALGLKVDKITGKSLIADTEITRLATVTNQTLASLGAQPAGNYATGGGTATGTNTGDQILPTKLSLGLNNVDNTSDVNKPISTAQQIALNLKRDKTEIGDAHGFVLPPNDNNFTLSNVGSSVTVNLLPNAGAYKINGTQYANTGLSLTFIATLGQNFINLNTGGLFKDTGISIEDLTKITCITVNWDGTNAVLADELHKASRNLAEHQKQHDTDGSRWVNGFVSTFGAGALNTFSTAVGVIRDEERYHTIGAKTQCRISYRNAALTAMISDLPSTAFAKLSGGIAQWDNNGVLANLSNNNYGTYYLYATNRKLPINSELVCVMGQGDFSSIANAQAAPQPTLVGMSVAEWKLLYIIIVRRTNALPFAFIQADDKRLTTTGLAVSGSGINSLSATAVTLTPTGNISATNVQDAVVELDNEKAPKDSPTFNGTTELRYLNVNNFGGGSRIDITFNGVSVCEIRNNGYGSIIGSSSGGGQLLSFQTYGVERARFSGSNGNFLINTTADNNTDKLQVNGSISATSSIKVGDNTVPAASTNVGAIRYRTSGNNSYCEMCMQTGASTYEWKIIYQNNW